MMSGSAPQTVIQILLTLTIAAAGVYFLQNRRKARIKAWAKIGFGVFVIAAVYAVLRPEDLTVVAQFLGVNRGADLLLYALFMAFIFVTLSTYVRFRELELRYSRLARAVALANAIPPAPADTSSPPPAQPPTD